MDETIDVVRKVQYDNAFTFIYSKRTGTPAATMPNPTSEEEIKANFDRLLAAVHKTAEERGGRMVGETHSVLVEESDGAKLTGRLSQNTLVHFEGDACLVGKSLLRHMDFIILAKLICRNIACRKYCVKV